MGERADAGDAEQRRTSLVGVLEAALEAEVDNHEVRLHLGHLLAKDDPAAALSHARHVLSAMPDHQGALSLAAAAAAAADDRTAAAGYERLVAALEPQDATDVRPEPDGDDHTSEPVAHLRVVDDDEVEQPSLRLADVAGLSHVKQRLEASFLAPARHPELRHLYATSGQGGLLLYGPPGCGKTFIARALAGELGASFLHVGLTDVLDMWFGESERRLHELFQNARRRSPSVLFLDEVDAVGQRRTHLRHSAGRTLVNQLLSELDGIGADNEGLFVLAATNQPWDIDPALRRPGRLDRSLLVLPPEREAREAVARLHLDGRPHEGSADPAWVARRTQGCSGADVAHICETAAQLALVRSAAAGEPSPIRKGDLQQAISEVRPSVGEWLQTARQYVLYADPSGEYQELRDYLRRERVL